MIMSESMLSARMHAFDPSDLYVPTMILSRLRVSIVEKSLPCARLNSLPKICSGHRVQRILDLSLATTLQIMVVQLRTEILHS